MYGDSGWDLVAAPATWKLDPALRERFTANDTGPFSVGVQPMARWSELEERYAVSVGLQPPDAPAGAWTAVITRTELESLLEQPWVGNVYDFDAPATTGATGIAKKEAGPYKPAKRGHTKLPPKR